MSGETAPISLAAFAEALKELDLSVIYAKVSELRNSMAHLRRSNSEMQTFVNESCDTEEDKRELENYITENDGVLASMSDRILLLRAEIEGRGQRWHEEEAQPVEAKEDQTAPSATVNGTAGDVGNPSRQNGSNAQPADDQTEQDGVYL